MGAQPKKLGHIRRERDRARDNFRGDHGGPSHAQLRSEGLRPQVRQRLGIRPVHQGNVIHNSIAQVLDKRGTAKFISSSKNRRRVGRRVDERSGMRSNRRRRAG